MSNNIDYKKISQEAVEETILELKKEVDSQKIDQVVELIDAANMIAGVVQKTIKQTGLSPEKIGEPGIKNIAKESARAALLEGLKNLK